MRNKILIVDDNANDRDELEQILQEIVEEGGELFFTEKREEGIAILKKEHPQLVFLEANLVGEKNAWIHTGVHVILMQSKNDLQQTTGDFLLKPLKRYQVLSKCRAILEKKPAVQIPPM